MKTQIYNTQGKSVGEIDLPEAVFGRPANNDLIHQVMVSMMSNKRQGNAHTKDRSEVRGGGKKPWKQKGTGRARHGSIRSPIWVGGGVAHGPRNEKNFSKKINRKMKRAAINAVLSAKMRDGRILFVDSLVMDAPKTKDARAVVDALASVDGYAELGTRRKNAAFVATTSADNENTRRSFANFSNIKLDELRKMSLLDLLKYRYIIIENPDVAIKSLSGEATN